LLGGAIGAAFVAGSWHSRQDAVSASGLHGRRILYYVDPMHPSYTSDTPGIAPDCNMPLEPVYADGGAPPDVPPDAKKGAGIVVDAARQQLIGVRVASVASQAGVDRVRLYGRVTAEETRIYKLNAGLDGYVRDLSGATTGSAVKKDDWLATYSSPDIRQPIQGFVAALDSIDRETKKGTVDSTQMAYAKIAEDQAVDRLI